MTPDAEHWRRFIMPTVRRAIAARMGATHPLFEDMLSAGYLAAFRAVRSYDMSRGVTLTAWVARRARGAAKDYARTWNQSRLGIERRFEAYDDDVHGYRYPDPEHIIDRRRADAVAKSALSTLPASEQHMISGIYFEGLSIKDTAQIKGWDKSWGTRLHQRAMVRLRRRMQHEGVQCP